MTPNLVALKLFLNELEVDSSIDTLDDRKRVQKAVYLGQVAGADMGYRFGWYIRGPYAPSLTEDYYAFSRLATIGKDDVDGKVLRKPLRDSLASIRPLLTPPRTVSMSQEDWLELLASLHFLRKVSRYSAEQAAQVIRDRKPHLYDYIEHAEKVLAKHPKLALD